jgi:hypothetical protein|tara:strand:- start:11903 stop:12058 length:156 start_codon:yes stop_codon:yes gene_type:complete
MLQVHDNPRCHRAEKPAIQARHSKSNPPNSQPMGGNKFFDLLSLQLDNAAD